MMFGNFAEIAAGAYQETSWFSLLNKRKFKWKENINEQCKKISSAIALLRRAKSFVPQNKLIRMYNSLVVPFFTYCSTVWNDGNHTNLEKLYKLQKRAARLITCSNYEKRSKTIFKNLKWFPIEFTLRKREILMPFKVIHRVAPEYILSRKTSCFTGYMNSYPI